MQLNNILVAVDGSANSDRALDFALGLSEKFGAALAILNVSESLSMNAVPAEQSASSGASMASIAKDVGKIHEEVLRKAVARAREVKPGLVVSSIIRQGDPAAEIVNAAKEGGFDVIVVGHKGMGKVREFFMGTISEKVAHLAICPVIIVK
jgi:nucleotide-binding universal stress UspA family protein